MSRLLRPKSPFYPSSSSSEDVYYCSLDTKEQMEWIKISKNGRAQGKKKAFSMAHIFCYLSLSLSLLLLFSLFNVFSVFQSFSYHIYLSFCIFVFHTYLLSSYFILIFEAAISCLYFKLVFHTNILSCYFIPTF